MDHLIKYAISNFPGSSLVENTPCNTGDMGSITGQGSRIPHVTEQGPCVPTNELMCQSWRVCAPQERYWGPHLGPDVAK